MISDNSSHTRKIELPLLSPYLQQHHNLTQLLQHKVTQLQQTVLALETNLSQYESSIDRILDLLGLTSELTFLSKLDLIAQEFLKAKNKFRVEVKEVQIIVEKEAQPIYITRQIEIEKPVYITRQIEVEKLVQVERQSEPIYITKQIEVEKPVYIEIQKPIYILKEVEVEIEKPIYITKEVEIEKPVYITTQISIETPVYIDRIMEKPIFIQKIIEKPGLCQECCKNYSVPHPLQVEAL